MLFKPMRALLPALLATALLGSCATETGEIPVADSGVSAIQFADIPVPAGMRLREGRHDSRSFQAGDFRYGDVRYMGMVPVDAAVSYMSERMKLNRWEQAGPIENIAGKQHLRFVRYPYHTHCVIWKETDENITRMNIEVRTKLQNQ
ncbi:MAG: hypothetical protein ACYTG5_02090 [Planctomycetota bacterium]|jgi:hypothetical protein